MTGPTVQAQNLAFAAALRSLATRLETTDLRAYNTPGSLAGIAKHQMEWALYEVGGPEPEPERIPGYELIEIDNGIKPIWVKP